MRKNKTRQGLSQRVAAISSIPVDMLTCLPYIKMCSNREMTVEDAGKLLHYDDTLIKVKQHKLTLSVIGQRLKLMYLSDGNLRITGIIFSLSFE